MGDPVKAWENLKIELKHVMANIIYTTLDQTLEGNGVTL